MKVNSNDRLNQLYVQESTSLVDLVKIDRAYWSIMEENVDLVLYMCLFVSIINSMVE